MGYYITLTAADFTIPADKLDEAYTRMCDLSTAKHAEKRGGSWGAGVDESDPKNRWFSWMDWNYPETCKDAGDILAQLGFDLGNTSEGGLEIWGYDSKIGQEHLFIEALAPLVGEGSFLDWRGEDGALWRQEVRNGQLVTLTGRVTYEEA